MGKKTILLLSLLLVTSRGMALEQHPLNPPAWVDQSPKRSPNLEIPNRTILVAGGASLPEPTPEPTPAPSDSPSPAPTATPQIPATEKVYLEGTEADIDDKPLYRAGDTVIVRLEWSGEPVTDGIDICVIGAGQETVEAPVETVEAGREYHISTDSLAMGEYQVQIAVTGPDGSAVDRQLPFAVEKQPEAPRPEITGDSGPGEEDRVVTWEGQPGVTRYAVSLKDADGKEIYSAPLVDGQTEWKINVRDLPDGLYTVEVKALGLTDKCESQPGSCTLTLDRGPAKPSVRLLEPESAGEPVIVLWPGQEGVDYYKLTTQLNGGEAKDQGKIDDEALNQPEVEWIINVDGWPNGVYTATVVAVGPNKKSDPAEVQFEVARALEAFKVRIEGETSRFSGGEIRVTWDGQPNVDHYEAHRMPGGGAPEILDVDTREWVLSADALEEGSYTIEITAIATTEKGGSRTGSAAFEITRPPMKPELIPVDGEIGPRGVPLVTGDRFTVNWEPSKGAEKYEVEVISGDERKARETVMETSLPLDIAGWTEGPCEVSVTAIGKYDDLRSEAASLKFEIAWPPEAPVIRIDTREMGLDNLPRFTRGDEVIVARQHQDGVAGYELSLEGPDGKGLTPEAEEDVEADRWQIPTEALESGIYTVRVTAIRTEGDIDIPSADAGEAQFEIDQPGYLIKAPEYRGMSLLQFWRSVCDARCVVEITSTKPTPPERVVLWAGDLAYEAAQINERLLTEQSPAKKVYTCEFDLKDLPARPLEYRLEIDGQRVDAESPEGSPAKSGQTMAIIFTALFLLLTLGFGLVFIRSSRLYRIASDARIDNKSGESTLTQRTDRSEKRSAHNGTKD